MRQQIHKEQRYHQIKKRVKRISKFYKSLSVYLVINILLSTLFIVNDIREGDTFNEAFFNLGNFKIWFWWGIFIVLQAISTFGLPLFFSKDWEDRKIKEYLKEERR